MLKSGESLEKLFGERDTWSMGLNRELCGTLLGVGIAFAGGYAVYGVVKKLVGIRLDAEEEFNGADLSIHKITATPEREAPW